MPTGSILRHCVDVKSAKVFRMNLKYEKFRPDNQTKDGQTSIGKTQTKVAKEEVEESPHCGLMRQRMKADCAFLHRRLKQYKNTFSPAMSDVRTL